MRLLFIIFIFFIASCGSKTDVHLTSEKIDSILLQDTLKPPVFKDSIISNYIKEYNTFIISYFTAIKNDDNKKIKDLQKQSIELIEKAKVVSDKLTTPGQLDRYEKWINKQQEKIQSLNKPKQ